MAERFAADWLTLREAADHRARSEALLTRLAVSLPRDRPLTVVDLGAGRGSNLRYLAPRLAGAQTWRVVDHDASLMADAAPAPAAADGAGVCVEPVVADLRDAAFDALLAGANLVTAAALIDLVSRPWLERLATACAARRLPALIALSYDGCIDWSPAAPMDERLRLAVNRHQRRDKGFGPALGPAAWAAAATAFRAAGCRVGVAASPWQLGPADAPLVEALVDGWVAAASEQAPGQAAAFRRWGADRRRGQPGLRVGHRDLLALPPA